ncbi:MAG: hypothetical protein Q8O15_06295 [Rectinemataceae bacterium]|nr:hypothetical protein [Rectinemataceae bacterium]
MKESNELTHGELLRLKRWNTPTIYNGWEAITKRERTEGLFNRRDLRDYMPMFGPMVGYAVTLEIQPSDPSGPAENPDAWDRYFEYVASVPGPKIVVVSDADKPVALGSFWGEVNANVHRSLGCVGTITDGAIRDVDEMTNAGFKALASRMCVGHLHAWPLRWGKPVEVFGCTIESGMLIHADKHGFLGIPEEDRSAIVEAAAAMDAIECETVISAGRSAGGKSYSDFLAARKVASARFREKMADVARKGASGEW